MIKRILRKIGQWLGLIYCPPSYQWFHKMLTPMCNDEELTDQNFTVGQLEYTIIPSGLRVRNKLTELEFSICMYMSYPTLSITFKTGWTMLGKVGTGGETYNPIQPFNPMQEIVDTIKVVVKEVEKK